MITEVGLSNLQLKPSSSTERGSLADRLYSPAWSSIVPPSMSASISEAEVIPGSLMMTCVSAIDESLEEGLVVFTS